MFQRITVKFNRQTINLGVLCEALLFYKHVNLIVNYQSLAGIIQACEYVNLAVLIRQERISIYYNNHAIGAGVSEKEDVYIVDSFLPNKYSKEEGIHNAINSIVERGVQNHNANRHLRKIILPYGYTRDFIDVLQPQIQEKSHLLKAIKVLSLEPDVESDITVKRLNDGYYRIESNYSKDTLWEACRFIAVSSGILYDGMFHNCTLSPDERASQYLEYRINKNLQNGLDDFAGRNVFHKYILTDSLDINTSMQGGGKTFGDFMNLLRKAEKFEEWLSNEPPTKDMLQAYLNKILEKTWLQKDQVKTTRWALFSLLGFLAGREIGELIGGVGGAVAGNTLSVSFDGFDDLILDQLTSGYKPDIFIRKYYEPFLEKKII